MAAKKFNLFATSSTKGFLQCLKAPEGWGIAGADISSLEPHVLAQFSRDPGYLKIYQNGQPQNCIYLYLGAKSSEHGHLFKAAGYNPDNPAPGTVSKAKKECAAERTVYKTTVLTCAYGGQEGPLQARFRQADLELPIAKCISLVNLFGRTFPGIDRFHEELLREWHTRGGYVLTGRGRPLAIPNNKTERRDLVALFCQSTGHDAMTRILYHQNMWRKKHKLEAVIKPWIVDLHDATYPIFRKDHEEEVRTMIQYGYDRFNEESGWDVTLGGDIKTGATMAELGD